MATKTIFVIEITCGDYEEKFTFVHKDGFNTAAEAHQKAHEIEQDKENYSDCYTTVKPISVEI